MIACFRCTPAQLKASFPVPPCLFPDDGIDAPYTPSLQEASIVQTVLSMVHRDIKTLDDEINCLQLLQNVLSHKRDALKAYATDHAVLLSPVRKLPFELLADIFVLSLPDENDQFHSNVKHQIMAPSHTCQQWRQVALSTPSLWSHFKFVLHHGSTESQKDCAKTWLLRSGTLPVSLMIGWNRSADDSICHAGLPIFALHCAKWRDVTIDVRNGCPEWSDGYSIITLPNLTRLKVLGKPNPRFFEHLITPALKDLELRQQVDWDRTSSHLASLLCRSSYPLTRLVISHHRQTPNVVMQILQYTPQLTELDIEFIDARGDEHGWLPEDLAALTFVSGKPNCLVPRLRILWLYLDRGGGGYHGAAFADMIESRWRQGYQSHDHASNSEGPDQLLTVTVRWPPSDGNLESAGSARLREFVSEGLDLAFGPHAISWGKRQGHSTWNVRGSSDGQ